MLTIPITRGRPAGSSGVVAGPGVLPVTGLIAGLVMSALLQAASDARPGARLFLATARGPLPGGAPPERQSRPAVSVTPPRTLQKRTARADRVPGRRPGLAGPV